MAHDDRVESAATVPDGSVEPAQEPRTRVEPAERVDRYVVLEELGSGGMGVVYAAYDPDLDRKVALKFLKTAGGDRTARLLREAQAMAQLSHPNVATCFDVGVVDGQVFVAMEYVDGTTLRGWLDEDAERSWHEIWAVFRDAARGLATAHAAGIVHRDFKPANVLVGGDGRARVTDFGLARSVDVDVDDDETTGGERQRALDALLTQTGTVMGTPRYMAPEQHLGQAADAGCDQFAFCVSLYEALYGEPPFAGDSVAELAAATIEGEVRSPVDAARVPRWRREILLRGLAADPAERWPSMDALIAALSADPDADRRQRKRRIAVASAFATVVALAILAFVSRGSAADPAAACDLDREELLAPAWSAERQAAVRAAFAATGHPGAAVAFEQVSERLKRRADRWFAMREEACVANRIRGEQSDTLFDKRVACLDRRLATTGALVDLFAEADDALIPRAIEAVEALPRIEDCADVELLSRAIPAPDDPAVRARVAAIEADIDRATTRLAAGHLDEGVVFAGRALAAARETGYLPVLGEALLLRAQYHHQRGEDPKAEPLLEEATGVLARTNRPRVESEAWAELVRVAIGRNEMERARAMLLSVRGAVARAGDDPAARLELAHIDAELRYAREDYEEALALKEEALDLSRELHGADSVEVAGSIYSIGAIKASLGRTAEAIEDLEQAVATVEELFGESSTRLADALCNLANPYHLVGRTREELAAARRCYQIRKRLLAPGSPWIAAAAHALAIALNGQGRGAEAIELLEEALEIRKQAQGEHHPQVANTLMTIGNVHQDAGELDAALDRYRSVMTIFEKSGATGSVNHGLALLNVGITQARSGACAAALKSFTASLAILEPKVGESHPWFGAGLPHAAACMTALGRHADAAVAAERALVILVARATPPEELAFARETLAEALWTSRADRARAIELATRARSDYERAGDSDGVTRLTAWLAERAPRPTASR
jgi:tetratricopeptide (TPR) repeat protein/predicted Ser/Thr protein kinase